MAYGLRWCALVLYVSATSGCATAPIPTSTTQRTDPRLDLRGATLTTPSGPVRLGLAAVGRPGAMVGVEARTSDEREGFFRVDHGHGRTEWWRREGAAVEHGVTLASRPAGEGSLRLELQVEGARAVQEAADVVMVRAGVPSARYAGLVVFDASGRRLPARLEGRGERIVIDVDDHDARYPIVIDPLFHALEIRLDTMGPPDTHIGTSVAIDTTGSRVLAVVDAAGVQRTDRVGSMYTARTGLTGLTPAVAALAISGDGTWTLVGMPNTPSGGNSNVGAVYLAQATATSYQARGTLTRPVVEADAAFGSSIAIDETATFAAVGAPFGASDRGVVTFFRRTGTTWSVFGTEAVGDDDAFLGTSLAMSADGRCVVAGGTGGGAAAGYVAVFRRGAGLFEPETELRPPGSALGDEFGQAVALDGDGTTLLASTPESNVVWAFEYDGTAWAQTASITSADSLGLGRALAIDHAGARAIASSSADGGSARVFARSGSSWLEAAPILPTFETDLRFAESIAISGDGLRAVIGIPGATVGPRAERGTSEVYLLEPTRALGAACDELAQCDSGFCADGVCCNVSCGSDTLDDADDTCQACSVAAGGATNGTCTPLTSPDVACRVSAGPCDIEERCTATALLCPDDVLATSECRPPAGPCDVAEICDGMDADCPSDVFLVGVECRAADGACDVPEVCLGDIASCPPDRVASPGTVCRESTDLMCDPLESCDGVAAACPADLRCAVDGGIVDGGIVAGDVGTPSPAGGCSCRAGSRPLGRAPGALMLLGLAVLRRRLTKER